MTEEQIEKTISFLLDSHVTLTAKTDANADAIAALAADVEANTNAITAMIDGLQRYEHQAEADRAALAEATLQTQKNTEGTITLWSDRMLAVADSIRDSVALLATVIQDQGRRLDAVEGRSSGAAEPRGGAEEP